jgi:hypothetical protein
MHLSGAMTQGLLPARAIAFACLRNSATLVRVCCFG